MFSAQAAGWFYCGDRKHKGRAHLTGSPVQLGLAAAALCSTSVRHHGKTRQMILFLMTSEKPSTSFDFNKAFAIMFFPNNNLNFNVSQVSSLK